MKTTGNYPGKFTWKEDVKHTNMQQMSKCRQLQNKTLVIISVITEHIPDNIVHVINTSPQHFRNVKNTERYNIHETRSDSNQPNQTKPSLCIICIRFYKNVEWPVHNILTIRHMV